MNLYGEVSSTYGVPGILITYPIQNHNGLRCTSLIGWGDTSAEFQIYINDILMGGARSSSETRTVQVWWDKPITANRDDIITVTGTHFSAGLRKLKANLMGDYV